MKWTVKWNKLRVGSIATRQISDDVLHGDEKLKRDFHLAFRVTVTDSIRCKAFSSSSLQVERRDFSVQRNVRRVEIMKTIGLWAFNFLRYFFWVACCLFIIHMFHMIWSSQPKMYVFLLTCVRSVVSKRTYTYIYDCGISRDTPINYSVIYVNILWQRLAKDVPKRCAVNKGRRQLLGNGIYHGIVGVSGRTQILNQVVESLEFVYSIRAA
jgi:hypothetical protein